MPRKTLQFEAREPFELPALRGRALPRRDFRETFYDTAGGRLGLAGFVLRRRIENGKGIWRLSVVCDGVPTLDVEAPGGPAGPPEESGELPRRPRPASSWRRCCARERTRPGCA